MSQCVTVEGKRNKQDEYGAALSRSSTAFTCCSLVACVSMCRAEQSGDSRVVVK